LDAGTFGTMGVGLGFAIATALYARDNDPGARVLCVEGSIIFMIKLFAHIYVYLYVSYK